MKGIAQVGVGNGCWETVEDPRLEPDGRLSYRAYAARGNWRSNPAFYAEQEAATARPPLDREALRVEVERIALDELGHRMGGAATDRILAAVDRALATQRPGDEEAGLVRAIELLDARAGRIRASAKDPARSIDGRLRAEDRADDAEASSILLANELTKIRDACSGTGSTAPVKPSGACVFDSECPSPRDCYAAGRCIRATAPVKP